MKALWRSCVLGLLCMSAQVLPQMVTVFQTPSSTSTLTVNSSVTITCSTTSREAMGLYLFRRFQKHESIIYLALSKSKISKESRSPEFNGRVEAKDATQSGEGLHFTLTLSLLQLHDTDLYWCSWRYFNSITNSKETHSSNGTIIIIKESVTKSDDCSDYILDIVFLVLSITAIPFVMCLLVMALFGMCKLFKKKFTPTRAEHRPPCIHPQPRLQPYSYLNTSQTSSDAREIAY